MTAFIRITAALLAACVLVASCTGAKDGRDAKDFVILSGSENEALEPVIKRFADAKGFNAVFRYKGSVDIMLELQGNADAYDAVWPASGIWITLGDKSRKIKYAQSILTSPVVFGIRKSLAVKLGFTNRQVKVEDLLSAIQSKQVKFIMTSASQSNSGASAYFGFLYALLGNPEYISKEDLYKPQLKEQLRSLLGGADRSSGSSGWLKDLYLQGDYDAMVNYESTIIETNIELEKQGREPMYIVYPVDGLVIADSQFGYVSKGDDEKEAFFKELQAYLLGSEVQQQLLAMGRRTGFAGEVDNAPANVFRKEWGIDTKKILSPIKLPAAEVISEALMLYQTAFRKPSLTVFCLDYSGSMQGEGSAKLKQAMQLLLDQETAKRYYLQLTPDDITVVIPFSDFIMDTLVVKGNEPVELHALLDAIQQREPGGQTDIYSPVIKGIEQIAKLDTGMYAPAMILMTDGESNTGLTRNDLQRYASRAGRDIPVFSIRFGQASNNQLNDIAEITRGSVFDGRKDLVAAFRKAKGYN